MSIVLVQRNLDDDKQK